MKKYTYLLFMTLCLIASGAQPCKSQTNFVFGYDASGNRISRTITLKSASIAKDSTETKKAIVPLEDQIGLQKIKIYPNPTKGLLGVEIPNKSEIPVNLQIYSFGGSLLCEVRLDGENGNIDLSDRPTGIYLLKISIGNKSAVWKIIKE